MKSIWLIAAAATVCTAGGPAFAQSSDPDAIEFSAPATGQRAAPLTPAEMEAATAEATPSVNPDAVRSANRRVRANRPAGEPGGTAQADLASAKGERASGNVTEKPLYWAGKLFYTKPDGDYVCSAQFIGPNIVLTAAHCVRDSDTGNWYENIAFALQYNDGKYGGIYRPECFATLGGWVSQDETKWNYDFATILVDAPSKTGHFGTRWSWAGDYNEATMVGYPVSMQDGQVIQVEKGPIRIEDGIVEMHHGNPKNLGGASGGAWIGGFTSGDQDGTNRVISVQSFHYEGLEGYGFGPYLEESFRKLWLFTENGCK